MLTAEGQKLNSRYYTDQGRVLIHRRNFTVLDRTPNQGYRRFTLKSASTQQSTVLTEKAGSPNLPLQLFQKDSSSTLPNNLFRFLFLKLWVICNPKNSILKINAVQFVYVELCYKILTSRYKKSNRNINISNISDLPFDVMCF